jgi:hypothetical protein
MMPWDYGWIERATLADENSWLVGAITPTVRVPFLETSSGRPIVPLGDAYMSFDPLGAQGANIGNRLAATLVDAIAARGDGAFDRAWIQGIYDGFFARWGGPAMRWTHLLLGPMPPAARYILLAQQGADGAAIGSTPKQELADAFASNFDDPLSLLPEFSEVPRARRWVARRMKGDWEAAKGFVAVGRRQLRNALSMA